MPMIDKAALLNYIGANVKYNAEDPLGSYSALLAAINDAPAAGWIPCSEKLPEINGLYLVTGVRGVVYALAVKDGRWDGGLKPVAWMPLPEPYKGDK